MILLFIGPSGSGKDTQADILARDFGYKIISTGELLRTEMANKTELGVQAETYVNQGKWVPDAIVYEVLGNYLQKLDSKNIILTGVVRTPEQVELLDSSLQKIGTELNKVVYFELSPEESVKRLSGRWICPKDNQNYHTIYKPSKIEGVCDLCGTKLIQREDDKPVAILKRLEEFKKNNEKILEKYKLVNKLLKLDASLSIEEISNNLLKELNLK